MMELDTLKPQESVDLDLEDKLIPSTVKDKGCIEAKHQAIIEGARLIKSQRNFIS